MTTPGGSREPFILFEIAGATYALRSQEIQQLEMVGTITPVPNAPTWVDGVVSLRGQVIPAVNLRSRFGFARRPADHRSRLVVVRSQGRTVGLVVDSAREFASIDPGEIRPPPEEVSGMSGQYLEGTVQFGERLVLVLDARDLFDPHTVPALPPTSPQPESGEGETES